MEITNFEIGGCIYDIRDNAARTQSQQALASAQQAETASSDAMQAALRAEEAVTQGKISYIAVTLTASGWDAGTKTQTVTASGVLSDETKQLIIPCPAQASMTSYYGAGILCTGQAEESLTFTAHTVPTEDIAVYVTLQEVTA